MVTVSIETRNVHRPEIRTVYTGRGTAGAVQQHLLLKHGRHDQMVWSILDTERRQAKAVWGPKVH